MKKYLILSILIFPILQTQAQDETWYIWIDTSVVINGEEKRMVSEEPFAITCCLKSGKYNRLQKSAVKWIQKNYDSRYEKQVTFRSIQDKSLALEVIQKAHLEAEGGASVLLVSYLDSCK